MQTTLPARTTDLDPASSWTPDRAVNLIASQAHSAIAWYGSHPVLQRKLTPAETELLRNRLQLVRRQLMAANSVTDKTRIERAVAAALTGYGKADQITIAAYTKLLSDLPAWAVEQACDDVRRGAVVGLNPDFPPAAPRIHQLADEKLVEARLERDKLLLLLTTKVEEQAPPPTPEQRERVAAKLQDFHEKIAQANPQETEQRRQERQAREEEKAKREEHGRRMQYILQGYEPPTNKHGITISMSLALSTGMVLTKRKPAPPPKCEFSPNEGDDQ